MILDALEHSQRYEGLNPGFRAAFAFLKQANLARLPHGRHEIDGDRVFALIESGPQVGREAARLEAHRRYIDVRYIIDGTDEVGWQRTELCKTPDGPYNEKADLGFFADRPVAWTTLPPGTFAIYFPEDAHAPLGGHGTLCKVVVKVAV